jgi:hypothetical protein
MPVQPCTKAGMDGFQFGPSGFCYTYPKGDKQAAKLAYIRALKQGEAIKRTGWKEK